MQTKITQNICDVLFVKADKQIEKRLNVIKEMINAGKINKVEGDNEIIEYIAKETLDVKRLQDMLVKVHQKDFEAANKAF